MATSISSRCCRGLFSCFSSRSSTSSSSRVDTPLISRTNWAHHQLFNREVGDNSMRTFEYIIADYFSPETTCIYARVNRACARQKPLFLPHQLRQRSRPADQTGLNRGYLCVYRAASSGAGDLTSWGSVLQHCGTLTRLPLGLECLPHRHPRTFYRDDNDFVDALVTYCPNLTLFEFWGTQIDLANIVKLTRNPRLHCPKVKDE